MSFGFMGFLIPELGELPEAVQLFNEGATCWCRSFHCDLSSSGPGCSRCDDCLLCSNYPLRHSEKDAGKALQKELVFTRYAEERGYKITRALRAPGSSNNTQGRHTVKLKD